MHCMDDQLTLRVPVELARKLDERARASGVKRSQVVREALHAFLDAAPVPARATSVRERLAPYIGAVSLDHATAERDELARRLRSHNWRE